MRKSFTQAQEDFTQAQEKSGFIQSFYLKENENNYIKFLISSVNDLLIVSSHNVVMTSKKGNKYYQLVDCIRDGCPLCKAASPNGGVSYARDVAIIPVLVLYNENKEYEPTYKLWSRSIGYISNTLMGYESRYGLDGIVEVERKGSGTSTTYSLYSARKGMNGEDLPELPDLSKIREDFEVKDDDYKSIVAEWDIEKMESYIATGSPQEQKEEAPRRRSF